MPDQTAPPDLRIRAATRADVRVILAFIEQLADFEHLRHEVEATEAALADTLFGDRPAAEVLLASLGGRDVGFALFFETYSTFLARAGHPSRGSVRGARRARGGRRAGPVWAGWRRSPRPAGAADSSGRC